MPSIVETRNAVVPISSDISNAYIDFSKMTVSVVALVADVVRDGRLVVGYGFDSNGRYAAMRPEKDWLQLKNNYSEALLYEIFYKKFIAGTFQADVMENEISASNTINRISGTVDEETGGLFQREKQWYHENTKLDLYVETVSKEFASVADWFLTEYLPVYGFGKDKTVGMGYLKICKDKSFNPDIFNVSNANAAVTLSMTAFDKIMEYRSYYRLMTKFGKLGGSYAFSSPTGGKTRPFKKPVMMMEPGSIFFTSEQLNNKPLLKDVHSDKNIRHAGVPLTLPLKTREDYA